MSRLGYELLKKKSDALTVRYRRLLKEIIEVSRPIRVHPPRPRRKSLKDDEGRFHCPVRSQVGEQRLCVRLPDRRSPVVVRFADDVNQASEIVEVHVDNVAGVKLPVFKSARRDVASGCFPVVW